MRITHLSRGVAAGILIAFAAGCDQRTSELPTGADARRPEGHIAPLLLAGPDSIPGQYLVVLNDGVAKTAAEVDQVEASVEGEVHFTYTHALRGFAATLSPAAVEALRHDPRVAYVAQDGQARPTIAQPNSTTQPGVAAEPNAPTLSNLTTQPNAPWGLDRIDQRDRPLNGTYAYDRSGRGVRVYVIDSGIRTTHNEFGVRASVGVDLVNDGQNGQDCYGTGTHMAGVAAGHTYGVAKSARVVAVRVTGCSGGTQVSRLIAGIEWVTANAQKPAVATTSISATINAALNQAVQASIASGVVYVVSAGEGFWYGYDEDYYFDNYACEFSPGSTPEALTVGASTLADNPTSVTNLGRCADLFAPGQSIPAAWPTSDQTISTPLHATWAGAAHVAGVAAMVLEAQPKATPAAVAQTILSTGTRNRLPWDSYGSPNILLFSPLTVEPPFARISLNVASLQFRIVRLPAGWVSSSSAPAASTVVAPRVTAAGDGLARLEAPAPASVQVAATAATTSYNVLLSNLGTGMLEWTGSSDQPWLSVAPASGALSPPAERSPPYENVLAATVNTGTLAPGTYNGALTFRVTGVPTTPVQLPVTMTVVDAIELRHGVTRKGLYGAQGSQQHFVVQVPAAATSLTVTSATTSGTTEMNVRYGAPAGPGDRWECIDWQPGSNARCGVLPPRAGTYYVMVRGATDYWGLSLSVTIGGPPVAPLSLTAAQLTPPTSVRLSWVDGAVNESSFTLGRQVQDANGVFGFFQTVATPRTSTTAFSDVGLATGSTYRYRIRACNDAGCSPWTYSARVVTPGVAPPLNVAAAALSPGSARVSWLDASQNETAFTVVRRLLGTDGVTWGGWVTVGRPAANSAQFDNTGLAPGRTYQYQVRACNATACSAWRATAPITPPAN